MDQLPTHEGHRQHIRNLERALRRAKRRERRWRERCTIIAGKLLAAESALRIAMAGLMDIHWNSRGKHTRHAAMMWRHDAQKVWMATAERVNYKLNAEDDS